MARFSVIKNLLILRRTYASAAINNNTMRIQTTSGSALMKTRFDSEASEKIAEKKEVYWMRNPTTGDWIPETHFDEVDVVELRRKLLLKK
ncbi:hypothetical protein BVRB_7g169230 isoform B [Beta vulgaris subsp. vulgaris]|nr:hypothetical protein BVRB_7g169230 isoform B [Beta vulgaris subsp. vulgaris]